MQFINLKRQYEAYQSEIDARVNGVNGHNRLITRSEVTELEDALASFVGVRFCIAVSNEAIGLELALRALEIGPGDEVITVPFNSGGALDAIRVIGARPVFVDIEALTFNMNAELLEAAVSDRTRAIVSAGLFGQMPDFDQILEVSSKYGIPVVEDASQSFGASYNGYRSCGLADLSCTSFFPSRTLSCLRDGGAVFTNNLRLAARLAEVKEQLSGLNADGMSVDCQMDPVQAAVLLAKLPHLEDELDARTKVANRYAELLEDYCVVPEPAARVRHAYSLYTVRVNNRDSVRAQLTLDGIPHGVYYPKCLSESDTSNITAANREYPEARRAAAEVVSLPMHAFLTMEEQNLVVKSMRRGLGGVGNKNAA